jgi:hypothetical protein
MKSAREWMRDPRAAGAIGLLALALVGYRIRQASDAAADAVPVATADMGLAGPLAGGDAPQRDAPPPVDPAAGATREVEWPWDRNPFLRADREDAPPQAREESGAAGGGPAAPAAVEPGLTLRGTVVSDGVSVAILGDRVVPLGETVDGWTVEKVGRRSVVIRAGNETKTLELVKPAALESAEKKGETP